MGWRLPWLNNTKSGLNTPVLSKPRTLCRDLAWKVSTGWDITGIALTVSPENRFSGEVIDNL